MPYKKKTRLSDNINCWQSRPLCKKDCDNLNANRKTHKKTAQRAPPSSRKGRRFRKRDLYMVPEPLITEIVASMGDQ